MSVTCVTDTMSSEAEHSDYPVMDLDHSKLGHMEHAHSALPTPNPPPHHPGLPESDTDLLPKDPDRQLTPISYALTTSHGDPAPESVPSWTRPPAPPRGPPHPFMPKLDIAGDSQVPVLTKVEHNNFPLKSEFLGRLKQEYVGAKEEQLRDLLLMSSMKTPADDTASKTLLQVAGQTLDLKTPDTRFMSTDPQGASPAPLLSLTGQTSMPSSLCPGLKGEGKTDLGLRSGSDARPKKIRHKKRVNGNKICLVCGDKALAHNFNVITCESCKAFFRRNALKSQHLQRCMFQNNCAIDKNTRRFCPSCRLKKCFDIGMKAELILDEEERRLRQEKKAQRIRQQAATSSTTTEGGSEVPLESSGISTMDPDTSFSPDASAISTTTHPSHSFSPSEIPQPASASSLQSFPLPSFHTLRNPVMHSPSTASESSTYGQSSSFGTSGGVAHSQPSSAETSPFSSFLSQLSTSSPLPFNCGQPSTQQNVVQSLPQSVATFAAGSPRNEASPSMESSSQKRYPQGHEEDKQQRQEGEPQPPHLEPASSGMMENTPVCLPGPAARIFKHVPRDQLPSDPFMYWIVSPEERLLLANLTNAYQEVLLSLPERSLCRNMPISDSYFIHDFLNEIDDAMYKIVQFSKHIADFRQMRKEDQIAMLKSSAMHTFGIACCAAYVHERDCWLSLRGDLTLAHLRKLTNDDPYIQVGVEYCRSVKSLVKNDFTIYALIHCMILFDPRDAKIVDRQIINQTRDKYVIMLKHYLESQYSYLFADEYFVAIQDRVREILHLAKSGNAMFKRYSSAFQPLITEMLSSS